MHMSANAALRRRQREADWAAEKLEAEAYKARSRALHNRIQHARTARIARALQAHWHTHAGVTRGDIVVGTLFCASMGALAWCWRAEPEAVDPVA